MHKHWLWIALVLPVLALSAQPVLEDTERDALLRSPAWAAQHATVTALSASGRSTERLAQARAWLADAERPIHAAALSALVQNMTRQALTDDDRRWLAEVAAAPEPIWIAHECGSQHLVPLFHLRTASAAALRFADQRVLRDQAQQLLDSGDAAALVALVRTSAAADRDALLSVLSGLAQAHAAQLLAAVAPSDPALASMRLQLAMAAESLPALQTLIGQGGELAQRLLADAPQRLPSALSLQLAQHGLKQDDTASASLNLIGALWTQQPAARKILLEALDQPALAPSAAQALSAWIDPALAQALLRRLDQPGAARNGVLLAFKLSGTGAAQSARQQLLGAKSNLLTEKERVWLGQ